MYSRSARLYDAIYHFKDYRAASELLHSLIQQAHPTARTLLDVACGTGMHLAHLRQWYEVEGVDLNDELLSTARERCPGVPFHQADMADFSLPRQFDVVTCLFSAIAYVVTPERFKRTLATFARHVAPGGLIVVEPWFSKEQLWTGTITANLADHPDLKIAWMYTTEATGDEAVLDMHYLVGTPQGVEHFTERHELGLFGPELYTSSFEDLGFAVREDHDGLFGRGMYVAHDRR